MAAGDVYTVRKMLEQGYSPKIRDANGWTLLHFSAAKGKERCVRVFLEHGGEYEGLVFWSTGCWAHLNWIGRAPSNGWRGIRGIVSNTGFPSVGFHLLRSSLYYEPPVLRVVYNLGQHSKGEKIM